MTGNVSRMRRHKEEKRNGICIICKQKKEVDTTSAIMCKTCFEKRQEYNRLRDRKKPEDNLFANEIIDKYYINNSRMRNILNMLSAEDFEHSRCIMEQMLCDMLINKYTYMLRKDVE